MKTKHTQGEWTIWGACQDGQMPIVAKGNAVAFIPYGHDDSEANAKLIASAPELLEVLIDICTNGTSVDNVRKGLRVINKAVSHSRYRKPESIEVDLRLDPSTKLDVWFRYLKERTYQGYTPDQIAKMWKVESEKYFKP